MIRVNCSGDEGVDRLTIKTTPIRANLFIALQATTIEPRRADHPLGFAYREESEASSIVTRCPSVRPRYSTEQLWVEAIYLNGSFARALGPKAQPIRNITGRRRTITSPRFDSFVLSGPALPTRRLCRPRSPARDYIR